MLGVLANEVALAAGEATAVVAPDAGGAIASFRWRECDVLRPAPQAARAAGDARQFASYPLVPYSNRIANATLAHGAGMLPLARNFGDHPHAIHGVGWQRGWKVAQCNAARARLLLEHVPAGEAALAWPFAFQAMQSIALSARPQEVMLTLTLTLTNTDTRAFPFGLGWHPFFPRTAHTELGFAAAGVWTTDATQLPTQKIAVPPQWRFAPRRAIGATTLDNVFTGWHGKAELRWPDTGLRVLVEADRACTHLVVFAPAGREYLALEPVTHMTDAFNRAARGESDTGTRYLEPGQACSCTMRIVATAHRQA